MITRGYRSFLLRDLCFNYASCSPASKLLAPVALIDCSFWIQPALIDSGHFLPSLSVSEFLILSYSPHHVLATNEVGLFLDRYVAIRTRGQRQNYLALHAGGYGSEALFEDRISGTSCTTLSSPAGRCRVSILFHNACPVNQKCLASR
jgi:hypothetical protein